MKVSSKKMEMLKRNKLQANYSAVMVLGLLAIMFFLQSCFEPQEGCLDVGATNFDPTADNPCEDCCTYPILTLSLSHRFGENSFNFNTFYAVDPDSTDFFTIQQMRFYLTNFHFENATTSVGVEDILQIETTTGTDLEVEDNFTLVTRDDFNFELGDFRSTGTFDTLRFYVGLEADVNQALPSSTNLSSDHALAYTSDSTNWVDGFGYVFNEIIIDSIEGQEEPLRLNIFEVDNLGANNLVEIKIPYAITIDFGRNVTIPIKIDYEKWMEGINFVGDTEQKIMEEIVNNTKNVFSIVE